MARIGNVPEDYTNATPTERIRGYTTYAPYWEAGGNYIPRPDNYTRPDTYQGRNDLSGNYASRIDDLERTVRDLRARIFDLEAMLWWGNDSILERLNELEKSAWFSYVDIK